MRNFFSAPFVGFTCRPQQRPYLYLSRSQEHLKEFGYVNPLVANEIDEQGVSGRLRPTYLSGMAARSIADARSRTSWSGLPSDKIRLRLNVSGQTQVWWRESYARVGGRRRSHSLLMRSIKIVSGPAGTTAQVDCEM